MSNGVQQYNTAELSRSCSHSPSPIPGDELQAEIAPVVGGDIEVCITNLPIPLPEVNHAKLRIKLTAVEEKGSEPDRKNFVELTTPYGSLTVFTDSKVCYILPAEDTRGQLLSPYVRVQVALRYDDVTGPYIPQLNNATEIGMQ